MNATTDRKPIETLTEDDVMEHGPGRFSAEASELGWPVGKYPIQIKTKLGNKQPLVFQRIDEHGTVEYRQILGCISLVVYND